MSSAAEVRLEDRQLERYLIGLLPEADAERLDELSVVDDDVAERLRIVEDDLVDAYVSGVLPQEIKERFESFYLSTERRRQKVKFARGFLAADRGAGPADTGSGHDSVPVHAPGRDELSPGRSQSRRFIMSPLRAVWPLAAAAAVLLAAGGGLFYQTVQLRSELSGAQRASAELSNRTRDLERQLDDQRAADVEAARAPAQPANPVQASPRSLPTIAFVLLPQTRDIGPIAMLAVPQAIDRVAFELRVEPNDFSRFQTSLTDPATNAVVWRSETLTARAADGVRTIALAIPAALLKAQHYSVDLSGLGGDGSAELVGSYAFQVVRR